MMRMRDPQRIPSVLDELSRTWEAQPDVTLAHIWAQLQARGVALNSSDAEVVDALREVRRDFPLSLSFPDATSEQPACVFIETEGPDRKISLNFRGEEAWIVVRTTANPGAKRARRNSESEPQPGVWQVSELGKCVAGQPLQVKDMDGISHRLGVIRQMRVLDPELGGSESDELERLNLSGTRHSQWSGDTYLVQLEDNSTILVDQTLRLWEQERREVHSHVLQWQRLDQCETGAALKFTDKSGAQHELAKVARILRVA